MMILRQSDHHKVSHFKSITANKQYIKQNLIQKKSQGQGGNKKNMLTDLIMIQKAETTASKSILQTEYQH